MRNICGVCAVLTCWVLVGCDDGDGGAAGSKKLNDLSPNEFSAFCEEAVATSRDWSEATAESVCVLWWAATSPALMLPPDCEGYVMECAPEKTAEAQAQYDATLPACADAAAVAEGNAALARCGDDVTLGLFRWCYEKTRFSISCDDPDLTGGEVESGDAGVRDGGAAHPCDALECMQAFYEVIEGYRSDLDGGV